jgi:hypothetical protein
MIFAALGRSRFPRALRDDGLARCSVSGSTVWIGLGPNPGYGRAPLEDVPTAPRSVFFVEAPLQAELIRAFARSRAALTVEHLVIGTSHDYAGSKRCIGYDMAAAVGALADARLPVLTRLSLGDMEMLFNGHRLLGTIGEIGHVFAAAPALEQLDLNGHFALSAPVRHERLRRLGYQNEDVGISGGPVSQETFSNLLSCSFPRLTALQIDHDDDALDPRYAIPEAFFAGPAFPALETLVMNHLEGEVEARLSEWKKARGLR